MVDINNHLEVKALSESCQILSDTLNKVEKNIFPGQSVIELDKIAEDYIISCNAKPAFKGYDGFPATLTVSIDDEIVHGIPKNIILKEGQIISIDCGVIYEEFNTDSAFTIGIGNLPFKSTKLIDTTRNALNIGIKQAIPNNHIGDIGYAIESYSINKGFSVVKEYVGHGIGKALHEDPQIPNYGMKSSGPKIIEGMALAIEPMLIEGYEQTEIDNDGWTVKTEDGTMSAHFEDTIIITNSGNEIIT